MVEKSSSSSTLPDKIQLIGQELYPTIELIIDQIALIAKTPIKNRELGYGEEAQFQDSLRSVLDSVHKKIKLDNYEGLFKTFHRLSLMRDYARKVWHGSVIGSILDGNSDLKNLVEMCKQISISLGLQESIWEELIDAVGLQVKEIETAVEILKSTCSKQISSEDAQAIAKAFDTTEDEVRKDIDRFKSLGYTSDIFNSVQELKDVEIVDSSLLIGDLKNYNFEIVSKAFLDQAFTEGSVNVYVQAWLALFRNSISVPIDIFTLQIGYFHQIAAQSQDFFITKLVPLISSSAQSLNYQVDLRTDKAFFKKILNSIILQDIGAKDNESPDDIVQTRKKSKGKSSAVSIKGFDLNKLRECAQSVKSGTGKSISLQVLQELHTLNENVQQLHLKDQKLKTNNNQNFFTVGNLPENDIYIPKTGMMHGTQFGLIFTHNGFMIRDYSALPINKATLLRIPNQTKYHLQKGTVISLSACVNYYIDTITQSNIKMIFQGHPKPPSKHYDPPKVVDVQIGTNGVRIGRAKKNNDVVIENPSCSSSHCTIFPDGIFDAGSTNGTYFYLKSIDEINGKMQSQDININGNYMIYFSDFILKLDTGLP